MKLSYICLAISSLFKGIGKRLIGQIPVESLPVPGWFIVGDILIKVRKIKCGLLKNCIEHTKYGMPDEYKKDLLKL